MFFRQLVCIVVLGAFFARDGNAQFISKWDDDGAPKNTFRLHPEKKANPVFRYQLLPPFQERRKGNAAVYYGKVTAEQRVFFSDAVRLTRIAEVPKQSLEVVKESDIARGACPEPIYQQLRYAAQCDQCDWQIPIGATDFFAILFPAVQQTREFGRLLAAKARFEIATGDFSAAMDTFQTGYALARNVGAGSTYIHLLVAIAIKSMMDEQLECFIQQSNAPNLFWALAALPKPFFSLREATELEMNVLELCFPELENLSLEKLDDYSDAYLDRLLVKLIEFSKSNMAVQRDTDAILADEEADLERILQRGYRRAQRLLMSDGVTAEEVKKLTSTQAVLIAGIREFHRDNEEVLKWIHLPYPQAVEGMQRAEQRLQKTDQSTSVLGLASTISPPIQQVFAAQTRSDRQTAVLQFMEALRVYADENAGQLPKKLSDLDSAPAPYDPVTGTHFQIETNGGNFKVLGPDLPSGPLDLRVNIVK